MTIGIRWSDLYSENDRFWVRWKCRYLVKALEIALDEMPAKTWIVCCEDAIKQVNEFEGWELIKNARTIQEFHKEYRRNKESLGFLDPKIPHDQLWDAYPVLGQRNNFREIIPGTSLKEILSALPDFQEEKTLLQYHAESRSTADCKVSLIRSPKCHPEIAGEGIEYDWAGAKSFYRRAKEEDKARVDRFRKLVKKSLESVNMNCRRSFSAKAREYMLAYDVLADWEDDTLPEALKGGLEKEELKTSAYLLDKVVKQRKSHRGVAQDGSWVNQIMFAMKERDVQ